MRVLRFLLPVFGIVTMLGCSRGPVGPQFTKGDVDAITQKIAELRTDFNARDPDKVAALFSGGAVVMPPNQSTSRGRDAVKQYYVGRFAEGAQDLELDPKDITGVGNLAYASGDFRLNLTKPGSEPQRDRGKFVWIFRKNNNTWQIEYVIFSSDFAPHA
jgi:uncharacterized protein (TIGR02246 family)